MNSSQLPLVVPCGTSLHHRSRRRSHGVMIMTGTIAMVIIVNITIRSWCPVETIDGETSRGHEFAFMPAPGHQGSKYERPRSHTRPTVSSRPAEVVSAPHQSSSEVAAKAQLETRSTTLLGAPRSTLGMGAPLAASAAYAALQYARPRGNTARNSGVNTSSADNMGIAFGTLGVIAGWVAIMYSIQHSIIGIPGLSPSDVLYFPIVATFIAGYAIIVLEEQTEINKAATALVLGVLIWVFVGTGLNLSVAEFNKNVKETLTDVSEVVFFLLGALTIVEIMDAHKGFDIITRTITQTRSRELLVVISVLTFLLSSVLNNLTVVIVMIALLQKIVKDDQLRLKLGGLVVVCSNAGGAWTPIGDITTTMLYIGGQVTIVPLLVNLFVPSILCLVGCVGFEWIQFDDDAEFDRPSRSRGEGDAPTGQSLIFWGGLSGMVLVPVFSALTNCPAWSGMMLVLGLLGVLTSVLHDADEEKYQLKGALERVEVPDCLFFLGVLFAVGGLEKVGLLKAFAVQLNALVSNEVIIATLLGFASAIVDNVPLVAAAQGMYDISTTPADSALWNLITFCAATGGSLLVIGSAAGVAFLGLEKGVSFGWYLQNITPAALVGYLFGIGGMVAQQTLGLTIK